MGNALAVILALASAGGASPPPQGYPPPPALAEIELPAPPAPPVRRGARLLWGVGVQGGLGNDQLSGAELCELCALESSGTETVTQAGVGLYVRLGDQLSDQWGVEGEISGGTNMNSNYLRGAITVDFTPLDWFTVAVGPTVRTDANQFTVQPCLATPAPFSTCGNEGPARALGGTGRLDLHLFPSSSSSGRSAWTLSAAVDLGSTIEFSQNFHSGLAEGGYLSLGYAHY